MGINKESTTKTVYFPAINKERETSIETERLLFRRK